MILIEDYRVGIYVKTWGDIEKVRLSMLSDMATGGWEQRMEAIVDQIRGCDSSLKAIGILSREMEAYAAQEVVRTTSMLAEQAKKLSKEDAVNMLQWLKKSGFCLFEDGQGFYHKDDTDGDWEQTPEQLYELYKQKP